MQHSYLKLFHRFLKRSDFKETRVSWQKLSQSSPDFCENQHFNFDVLSHWNPKKEYDGWPEAPTFWRKILWFAQAVASILRQHVLGGKVGWCKSFQKMHHNFFSSVEWILSEKCLQKIILKSCNLKVLICLYQRSFCPDLLTCRGGWNNRNEINFEKFLRTSFLIILKVTERRFQ